MQQENESSVCILEICMILSAENTDLSIHDKSVSQKGNSSVAHL